jgi:hypothetical protein
MTHTYPLPLSRVCSQASYPCGFSLRGFLGSGLEIIDGRGLLVVVRVFRVDWGRLSVFEFLDRLSTGLCLERVCLFRG